MAKIEPICEPMFLETLFSSVSISFQADINASSSLDNSLSISFSSIAGYSPKVIYGDDNRVDVYESSNGAHVELSKSTAAMIEGSVRPK